MDREDNRTPMTVSTNGRTSATPGLRPGRLSSGRRRKETGSLTERTYQVLRRDILTCALEPGSEISEADIADRLSISKTPVREALGRLRVEGFVKTFPRRGYQIVPLTIADMDELFDVRTIVEGGCGEMASERITADELDRLAELADASYDRATSANLDKFISANRDFHMAIANAAGNRRLQELVFKLLDELERFFYIGARKRDLNTEVHSDHHRIVEVLRERDPEAARQIMMEHNEATRRGLFDVITASRRERSPLVIS
jgi:DNA-binding GntR family transcriptional regulator